MQYHADGREKTENETRLTIVIDSGGIEQFAFGIVVAAW
jgi:hypothetical protein